ncbi:MAG: hypothetical protein CFH19_00040 [Alphaproteobacteria bacterium MarineAlpha5_Bin9]|nr:MAG: hypothetical protein CFH19_00040 [Alphaproteobacteria bacterium MarineAlpha5_Bin9]|tara:strand:+ start:444 stop:1226 length:783 start_codon:yes stop_codon:yes gene_type:complete
MTFYLSKVLWGIINPFNILLFFIVLTFFLSFLKNKITYKFFFGVTLAIFILIAVLPTGKYLSYLLEKKYHTPPFLPDKIDGIIIISGATSPILSNEHNTIILNGAVERLIESIELMKKYNDAKIVFTGGSGSLKYKSLTHAKVAKDFFIQQNININRIIFEDKSRNTYENILFSKEIIQPLNHEKWIVVTSAFHMNRVINISEKLNWKLIPYPVDYRRNKKFSWRPSFNFFGNIQSLESSSHEWVGLISYYFLGRSSKIY